MELHIQGNYQPGRYIYFYIHEPKSRKISAAPFRDHVIHHALCNVIKPRFEKLFIADSYANRKNKGTHLAVNRLQAFSKHFRYELPADIVKHFPAINYGILKEIMHQTIVVDDIVKESTFYNKTPR